MIQVKLTKRKVIIVLALFILGLIAYLVFSGQEEPTIPEFSLKRGVSVIVQSSPPNGKIFLNDTYTGLLTPNTVRGLETDKSYTVSVQRSGYYKVSENVLTSEDGVSVSITLVKAPSVGSAFTGRLVDQAYLSEYQNKPLLVYRNPVSRLVEVNTSTSSYALLENELNSVNEISWKDPSTAIVNTGNLAAEKKDYLLDLSPWEQNQPPTATLLPFSGSRHAFSPDGNRVAFFGSIDFGNASSSLAVYDFQTSKLEEFKDVTFSGGTEMYWVKPDLIYVVEEHLLGEQLEGSINKIFRVSRTWNSWSKVHIADASSGEIAVSPGGNLMYYANGYYHLVDGQNFSDSLLNIDSSFAAYVGQHLFISDTQIMFFGMDSSRKVKVSLIETAKPKTIHVHTINKSYPDNATVARVLKVKDRVLITLSSGDALSLKIN